MPTANLGLPYIIQSQANKELTHQQALDILDSRLAALVSANSGSLVSIGASGQTVPLDIGDGLGVSDDVLSVIGKVSLTGNETIAGIKTFSSAPNLSSLTGSRPLSLDASKNIQSPTVGDFNTSIGLGTASNVQFGAVGIGVAPTAGTIRVATVPQSQTDGAGAAFTPTNVIGATSALAAHGFQIGVTDGTKNPRITLFVDPPNDRFGLTSTFSTGLWRMQFRHVGGVAELTSGGQWMLPGTGSSAGLLLGGDFLLHRHATEAGVGVIASGDTLQLDNLTASRPVFLDASKRLTSPTAADFNTSLGLGAGSTPIFADLQIGNSQASFQGTYIQVQDSFGGNYNGAGTLGQLQFYNNAASNTGVAAAVVTGRGLNVVGSGVMVFRTASALGVLNDVGAFSHTGSLLLGDSTFIQSTSGGARLHVRTASQLIRLDNAAGTELFGVTNAGQVQANAVGSAGGLRLRGDWLLHGHASDANVAVIASGDSLQLDNLTASRPVFLDASKRLTSPTAADFNTSLGLGTTSSPTFRSVLVPDGLLTNIDASETLASAYPNGISYGSNSTGSTNFPAEFGGLLSVNNPASRFLQFWHPNSTSPRLSYRVSAGGVYSTWQSIASFTTFPGTDRVVFHSNVPGVMHGGNTVDLYIAASNILALGTGDSLQLDNLTASRLVELDANKRLASVGFASSDVARLSVANAFTGGAISLTGHSFITSVTAGSGLQPQYRWRAGGVERWICGIVDTETGSNAGSDWGLARYSDAGGFLQTALRIQRVDGRVIIYGPLQLENLTASARVRTDANKRLVSITGDAIFSDAGFPVQFGTIATMPSGADAAEGYVAVGFSFADGTTSMTIRIRGIRVYCTGGTTTNSATFIIEKSSDGGQTWSEVGGAANTSTTVASASRTGLKTSFGTAPTFASGDLLRVSGSDGSGREDIIVALDCQRTS